MNATISTAPAMRVGHNPLTSGTTVQRVIDHGTTPATVPGAHFLIVEARFYEAIGAMLLEGAERALIRDCARESEIGTAFGWYYFLSGLAAIPAGIAFGGLWQWQSAAMAFSFAAGVAAACALLLMVLVKDPRAEGGS